MKIKIEICCDSAAFEGDVGGEIARILREQADEVESYHIKRDVLSNFNSAVRDVNGNRVGFAESWESWWEEE